MPVAIQSVKFWINAFIPANIPGYTITVPAGPHAAKTMIPGPGSMNIRIAIPGVPASGLDFLQGMVGGSYRTADLELFRADGVGVSDCYLTDQRTFSKDIHAKSRMHSEFRIDFTGSTARLTQWHNCDYTTELDCEDGDVECHKKGATDRMSFRIRSSGPPASTGPIAIEMECAAYNPCSPSSRLFGDIDYKGTVTVDPVARRVEVDAMIDQFPAFEAYATINDGAGVALFQIAPPSGNTVMNLPRGANRRVRYSMRDANGDGIFEEVRTL